MKFVKHALLLTVASLLSGCNMVVMSPSGDIAQQQSDLIVYATILMLIVVLPVMALTVFFAIKYRSSNKEAAYEPDWHHSTSLEIVIWAVPMAIILCLAGLTWVATHRLDPYQPLSRISVDKSIDETVEPLVIQAVAMDWKWLFIYPEYGIATVNEAAAPVDRPIRFEITSSTVMNSLYIPALAGQIYAMAGMQTELNAVLNHPGEFKGFGANYSGLGFTHMNFKFHGIDDAGFEKWVDKVRDGAEQDLGRHEFLVLDQPTISHPVTYYGSVDPELWTAVINQCVDENELCQNDMMMVDALGGGGLKGLTMRELFAGICTSDNPAGLLTGLQGTENAAVSETGTRKLSLVKLDLNAFGLPDASQRRHATEKN
ncbi:ubiquinol oxidase subunit II [Roseibium limicola]|uniref:Ubiquinol oxidase polypeptide II n=1 Tax=Roseibium limicola TaxID=2816037 RepID=A0A939EN69_9HYPH|nr:ubiquinol oxidase subunit II [Roseibium limicola]MBO0344074.1 ubiquinol oxidase subunit II [Roseibium limicola]